MLSSALMLLAALRFESGVVVVDGCQWLVVTWRGENEAVTFGNMNVLNSAFIQGEPYIFPGVI